MPTNIDVADYDPSWPAAFERIAAFVWPAVAGVALRVEHVGSTAVPGLAAKPVIDADVVVASDRDHPAVISALSTLGYRWVGDLGVVGREAFRAPDGVGLASHHLYAVTEGGRPHADHWLLRDLLIEDPVARERYATLKRTNARLAGTDLDRYTALKASLVAELLARARHERHLAAVEYWRPGPDDLGGAAPTASAHGAP